MLLFFATGSKDLSAKISVEKQMLEWPEIRIFINVSKAVIDQNEAEGLSV